VTGTATSQLARDELTPRIFRALYAEFDLRIVEGTYVVVPRGTTWFAGPSLGEIARQISQYEDRDEDMKSGGSPADPG
jgi:hypothetical protein